ncbi:uncharacterized protein LOC106052396 [Biomphalaria glabrata]|uniref:Uncharacterized protein LOC106052396 n=1 Tax=Biomphalaria glabrata TaxID=6526 RepID=A0A9U8DVW7_BIOGL|nr:uncharacterized protein LOC106052396 [Biomphalaria glabrata]
MGTLEWVFILCLASITRIFCQETCVTFQSGVFSSNKMTTTRGFMHCEISLPCTQTDVVKVMALEIYSLPATRLARLDETQKVDITGLASTLDLGGMGSIKRNGTSAFSVQFNTDTLKNGDTFQCRAVVRSKGNKVVNISVETSLALPSVCATEPTPIKAPVSELKDLIMDVNPLDYDRHQYYLSEIRGLSSDKANKFCESQGGYLVEINDEDEFVAIVNFLKDKNIDDYASVYIGGTDAAEESKWVFQHSNKEVDFFKWDAGEPNNLGGEDCMVLRNIPSGIAMNDISCKGKLGAPMFMCEFDLAGNA